MIKPKVYLGDAVFAMINDHGLIELTTSDGISETNKIYLDPNVWSNLLNYMKDEEQNVN